MCGGHFPVTVQRAPPAWYFCPFLKAAGWGRNVTRHVRHGREGQGVPAGHEDEMANPNSFTQTVQGFLLLLLGLCPARGRWPLPRNGPPSPLLENPAAVSRPGRDSHFWPLTPRMPSPSRGTEFSLPPGDRYNSAGQAGPGIHVKQVLACPGDT